MLEEIPPCCPVRRNKAYILSLLFKYPIMCFQKLAFDSTYTKCNYYSYKRIDLSFSKVKIWYLWCEFHFMCLVSASSLTLLVITEEEKTHYAGTLNVNYNAGRRSEKFGV